MFDVGTATATTTAAGGGGGSGGGGGGGGGESSAAPDVGSVDWAANEYLPLGPDADMRLELLALIAQLRSRDHYHHHLHTP